MAVQRVTVGAVEITALSDGILELDPCSFFPDVEAEKWHPYEGALTAEENMRLNLGSFLVRSDGHTILFDTGLGPKPADDPNAAHGELVGDLKSKGLNVGDIDMVVMTHLHRDHVGWNLQSENGRYQPTFPRARYWVSAKDWEACYNPEYKDRFPNAPACVWPLEELGLIVLYDGEHALTSHLTALPTPGHTPGHMSIVVSSEGERALLMGDAAHSPVQVQETDWNPRADIHPEQAVATRRQLFEKLERDGTLVASGHFPAPGFGRVVRLQGRRYWQALE